VAESVWDYPRPPRVELTGRRVRVEFGGEVVADTRRATRVLETSHPPTYYIPLEDVVPGALVASGGATTYCEWKGHATYYDVVGGMKRASRAAWTYHDPSPDFELMCDAVAFYPSSMDACWVDEERVEPQPGGFYGGWITSDVVGPFKGEPGTLGS
jgi:uncharacterized protein (DUF427 family)